MRRRLRGYSRFRCRRCGAPLKDRISITRGYGHECWCKVHPGLRRDWDYPRRPQPREYLRPRRAPVIRGPIARARSPPPRAHTARDLAKGILKTAVIGASCSAIPTACPAILALGHVSDLLGTARTIVNGLREKGRNSGQMVQGILSEVVTEAANRVVGPWTQLAAQGIASQIVVGGGVARSSVRQIASGTISNVLAEGMDGAISWGAKRFE